MAAAGPYDDMIEFEALAKKIITNASTYNWALNKVKDAAASNTVNPEGTEPQSDSVLDEEEEPEAPIRPLVSGIARQTSTKKPKAAKTAKPGAKSEAAKPKKGAMKPKPKPVSKAEAKENLRKTSLGNPGAGADHESPKASENSKKRPNDSPHQDTPKNKRVKEVSGSGVTGSPSARQSGSPAAGSPLKERITRMN